MAELIFDSIKISPIHIHYAYGDRLQSGGTYIYSNLDIYPAKQIKITRCRAPDYIYEDCAAEVSFIDLEGEFIVLNDPGVVEIRNCGTKLIYVIPEVID